MKWKILATLVMLILQAQVLHAEEDEGLKLLRQGLERLERGDFDGALIKFRDAQIERPESPEIHFNIGMALYKLERFEEARAAFDTASHGADLEIEKKALFHKANCYVKEGKYEESLDTYNRALMVDEDYEAAKVNREWVIRKMKELARKQKEQEDKAKEERRIIEKLQEIIQKQTMLHGSLRLTMKGRGIPPQPSRVPDLAPAFDQEPTAAQIAEAKALDEGQYFEEQEKAQADLLELLVKLTEEARSKIEAKASAAGQDPTAQQQPQQADPEIAKLEKAVPHLDAAEPAMERALKAAQELDFIGLHAGQEAALESLLKALDELLDELSLLIKDQARLLKSGFEFARLIDAEDPAQRPNPDQVRDHCVQDAQTQNGLRDRSEALSKGIDQQLGQLRQAAEQAQAPGGQGTAPGQDPNEQLRRYEAALGHMNAASDHMEKASVELLSPALQNGLEEERQALEELVKARTALQPPSQGGNKKSDQQDQQQNQNQDQQDQEQNQDGESKDGEQGQPKESEGQEKDAKPEGQEGEEEQKAMSEEQAEKTLDRARQQELDRRREEQEARKRAARTGRSKVEKDW